MGAEIVFKATDVDGVYSSDPKKDRNARRYDRLTHQEAIDRNLKVMDTTAFALAQESRMPIIVFSIREQGAITGILRGNGALHRRRRMMTWTLSHGTLPALTQSSRVAMASPTHDLNELKRRMQGAIQLLKQELGGLRTGRASASLLEPIQVEAYGYPHAAQPGGDHQRARAPTDFRSGLGQIDGPRGGKGDRGLTISGLRPQRKGSCCACASPSSTRSVAGSW